MNYIISENKLNSFIENYFEKNDKLSNLKSVDSWNGLATNYFQNHINYGGDYSSDYSFAYFPDLESYDYKEVYNENDFPMVEMNTYLYSDLVSIFTEKIIGTKLLEWINKTYGLDAIQLLPD